MKNNILEIFTFFIAIITSCSNSDNDYVVVFKSYMDTQIALAENPSPKYLKTPTSKSVSYICHLDLLSMYGPTLNMAVKNITNKKYSHVKISRWIRAANKNAQPIFVLDIKVA